MRRIVLFISICLFSLPALSQDIIVSSYPVKMIVREITGPTVDIGTVVPFGADPFDEESFDKRYLRGTEIADAFIYISDDFETWAKDVKAVKKINLFDFIPPELLVDIDGNPAFRNQALEKAEKAISKNESMKMSKPRNEVLRKEMRGKKLSPYFWTDPLAVESILPELTAALAEIMPEHAAKFNGNATRFTGRISGVNIELRSILEPAKYKPFFQTTPVMNYFSARFKLYNTKPLRDLLGYSDESYDVFSFNRKGPVPEEGLEEQTLTAIEDNNAAALFYTPYDFGELSKRIRRLDSIPSVELSVFYARSSESRYFDLLYENAIRIRNAHVPPEEE